MFFKKSPANQQPTSIKYPNSCQTVVNLLYFPHRKLSSTETAVNDIRTKSNILTRFKVESKKKRKNANGGKCQKSTVRRGKAARENSIKGDMGQRRIMWKILQQRQQQQQQHQRVCPATSSGGQKTRTPARQPVRSSFCLPVWKH